MTELEPGFQLTVITKLSELGTKMQAVVDHLARLNGSVARHEEAIGQLRARDAEDAGRRKGRGEFWNVIKPLVYLFLGAVMTLLLLNGKTILEMGHK